MAELRIRFVTPFLLPEYWHAVLNHTLGWLYTGGVWFILKIAKLNDDNLRCGSIE